MVHPPPFLQGTLWLSDLNLLDIEKDKNYIIHQIFSHGGMEEIWWVMRTYGYDIIRTTFKTTPYKDYPAPRFNFIKNYLLQLQSTPLDERNYVKNIPRNLGH
jgi:hypothetical protein